MSTITRTCILCNRKTLLVSDSFGQWGGWAAATCPVICSGCAASVGAEPQDNPHTDPHILFEGAKFWRIAGHYVGPRGFRLKTPSTPPPSP